MQQQKYSIVIIGGGASVTATDIKRARAHTCMTINSSIFAHPKGQYHYFCDYQWWCWYGERKEVKAYQGEIYTSSGFYGKPIPDGIKTLHRQHDWLISDDIEQGIATGNNSGYQAINLAYLLGYKRIYLLGYDGKQTDGKTHHYSEEYPLPTRLDILPAIANSFRGLNNALKKRHVDVINCNPNSAIKEFEYGNF